MNENEIIKALECCISEEVQGCKDCPLLEFSMDCDECRTELMKKALDIIKRKNAESEEQKYTNQKLTSALKSAKAEIERLKRHNKEYGFINLLGNCLVYSKNLKDYNDMRKGLKSEGRREFAEKVKNKLHNEGGCDAPKETWARGWDEITEYYPTLDLKELNFRHFQMIDNSQVNMRDLYNYANGKHLYGWHISNLIIYDKPKELSEFFKACDKPKGTDCSVCVDHRENRCKAITRPPQSWCYVEGGGSDA